MAIYDISKPPEIEKQISLREIYKNTKKNIYDTNELPVKKEKEPVNLRQIYKNTRENPQILQNQKDAVVQNAATQERDKVSGSILKDIALQPVGGIVDAAESIANLVLPKDKHIEISDFISEPETAVGGFIRPMSQFLIPYTGAFKIARGSYLLVKNAGGLKKTVDTIDKARKVTKKKVKTSKKKIKTETKPTVSKSLSKKETFGIGMGAGALTDAFAFAPYDPNLADLLVQFPATKNALTEWLQTDANDDPSMARLKNTISGAIPGAAIPMFLSGVGKGFIWSKGKFVTKEKTKPSTTTTPKKEIKPKAGQIYTDSNGDRIKILDILEPKPKSGVTTRTVRTQNLDKPSRTVGTDSYNMFLKRVNNGSLTMKGAGTSVTKQKKGTLVDSKGNVLITAATPKGFIHRAGQRVTDIFRAITDRKSIIINGIDDKRSLYWMERAIQKRGLLFDPKRAKGKKGVTGKTIYTTPKGKEGDNLGIYQESRFMEAVNGMVEHFLIRKTFRFKNGEFTFRQKEDGTFSQGIKGILEQNLKEGDSVDDFFQYFGAKSLKSLKDKATYKKLVNTKSKEAVFKSIIKEGDQNPNYVNALKDFKEFNSQLLDIAVDSQLISPGDKARFLANREHYLPFYRDMSNNELFSRKSGASKLRKSLKANVPIGSEEGALPLGNLFDNYIENVEGIISSSYKNHVKLQTFRSIDQANATGIVSKVNGKDVVGLTDHAEQLSKTEAKKFKKITLKSDEVEKEILKQKGEISISPEDLKDVDDLVLFRSERIQVGDDQQFVFRTVNGKTQRTIYNIRDKHLLTTLNSISPKEFAQANALVQAAKSAKTLLTRAVTLDPGFFAYANFVRDTVSAAILSRSPMYVPFMTTAKNVYNRMNSTVKQKVKVINEKGKQVEVEYTYKELFDEFQLNGGSFGSTLYRAEISDKELANLYRQMGHSDYSKNVLNTPQKMLANYEKMVTGFENASRFTEYAILRKAGYSAREAAYNAREVAVDFGMHGASSAWRNYVGTVPFLNAGIQGLFRTARALTPGSGQVASVYAKMAAYVGGPTLMFYAMNRNNPDYWNQSQEVRDMNYMLPLGEGNWLKLPKAFEFGAIGTILENFLVAADKDGNYDKFLNTSFYVVKNQLRLSFLPQVIAPLYNARNNENFFGSPIVPEGMKNSLPDFGQSYPWTSRSITHAINSVPLRIRKHLMSPIEFENYYRSYTGTIGGYLLDLVDEGVDLIDEGEEADYRWDELPVLKRFLTLNPTKFSSAEQRFYEFKKIAVQAKSQFAKFQKDFEYELLEEFINDPIYKELIAFSAEVEALGMRLSDLNSQRNLILNNKTMSGAEKLESKNKIQEASSIILEKFMEALVDADLKYYTPILPEKKPLRKVLDSLSIKFGGKKMED